MTESKINKNKIHDIQRNAWNETINNPLTYGYSHHTILEKLITGFPTLRYACMADEIGEQGTPHTHIYIYFNSRVRFSTLKRRFPEAHLEPAHGSVDDNIDYIKKRGKWENTEKAETRVEGTFEEWGDKPIQKGKYFEYEELYQMIRAGYSNSEILAYNNDYILDIDRLDKVRTTLLIDEFKEKRRLDLKVVYISGATGTGKTRGVLDEHGDSNVYRVSDYQHPFDGYACQTVIAFDEFRNSLKLSDMLNYCDIYPIQLPARYSNKFACYNTVYIISNWRLEEQYQETQKENKESWKAFLRRIHEVRVYDEDGNIKVYHSVDEYLNRDTNFHEITKEEQETLPFGD